MSRPISIEELLGEAAWLRRLAVELVADSARADDLVQETWIAALRRPPAADVAPRRWLARVARNLATNMRRAEARRADHEAQPPPRGLDSSPAALAQAVETQRLLAEAVAKLDEPLRAVIVLRYFKELDSQAIARELGLSPSAVRTRLQKAIEALRAELDRKFEGGRAAWSALLDSFLQRGPVMVAAAGSTLVLAASIAGVLLLTVAGVTAWRLVSSEPVSEDKRTGELSASADVGESGPRVVSTDPAREPVAAEPARSSSAEAPTPAVEYAELSGRVLVDGRPPEWPVGLSLTPDEPTQRMFGGGRQLRGVQFSLTLTPDTDGVFSSKLPASWSGRLGVSHYTFDNGESSIALPSPVAGLILDLHPGPAILGRFIDEAGAPVAGLEGTSEVRKIERNGDTGSDGGLLECRTDGRFRAKVFPWGQSATATILVEADGRGYLRFETPAFDPTVGYQAGDLVLERVRALEFQLHDPQGQPIAGAFARVDGPAWSRQSEPTDEHGAGVLRFAPERAVAIRFSAFRFADRVLTVESGLAPEVELEPLSMLEIQLVASATTRARLGKLLVTADRSLFIWGDSVHDDLQVKQGASQAAETSWKHDASGVKTWFQARYRPSADGRYLLVGLQPDVPFSIDVQDAGGRSLAVRNTSVAAHEWARLEIPVGP